MFFARRRALPALAHLNVAQAKELIAALQAFVDAAEGGRLTEPAQRNPPPLIPRHDPPLFADPGSTAVFDGPYRYLLTRATGSGRGTTLFVMLNPSTATEFDDDPTIAVCTGFARRWGTLGSTSSTCSPG